MFRFLEKYSGILYSPFSALHFSYVCIAVFTLDAGLLARSQYS